MDENLLVFKQKPDFVILPEYFNVDPTDREPTLNATVGREHLAYCRTLSDRFDCCLIAGTAIEADESAFYNTCTIFDHGRKIGTFRKLNPTLNELNHGISPGDDVCRFAIGGITISVLICADVLFPQNFERLSSSNPDIVFVPITSPHRPGESPKEKFRRDNEIFVSGAKTSGAFVVKCCAIGGLWGGRLQGRSLVAAPWGVLTRIDPVEEDSIRILSIVLDIAEIREFRRKRLELTKSEIE